MIIAVLILALILRLFNLNQSLWLDEAVQAITAQKSFGYIFQEITGDFHPPLYHFLMHFWVRVFGSSEISLRIPSVIFGVGTVYLVYRLGKLGGLGRLGLLGATFLATAPFHIYYSQEARMYSIATFFTTGSFYFFLRILEDDRGKLKDGKGILYFIFTLFTLYADYYGFLVLLAQGVFLLIKKRYKFLFISYGLLFLAYLPWFPMLVIQLKTGMLATQSLPGWSNLVSVSFWKALPLTFIKFSLGRITIFNKKIYGVVILGVLGVFGGIGGYGMKGNRGDKGNEGKIILLWFAIPLLVSWLASLFIPNYQPFRLLLILPAFYLLLARGIEGLGGKRWAREIAIGIVLFVNLVSLSVYYLNPYFHREDWRGVAFFLLEQQNIEVILPSSSSNWPIRYYDPEKKIKLTGGTEGVGEIREMGEIREIGGSEVYYIRYLVPLFDPNELILAKLHEQGYTKTREISFNQIPVWEFNAD